MENNLRLEPYQETKVYNITMNTRLQVIVPNVNDGWRRQKPKKHDKECRCLGAG